MPERVVIHQQPSAAYSGQAPFHPARLFPEYAFGDLATEPNPGYEAVRSVFQQAGLDDRRYGTAAWNPLRELIRPGEVVLLKPNLVKEQHPRDPAGWQYLMTHGSIIRAVADYVWKALEGRGAVIVADAPQTDSSFTAIIGLLGLDAVRDFYQRQGLRFELIDLRREEWVNRGGVIVERRPLPGDPRGNVAFDLADRSEFVGHPGAGRYYGADYDARKVNYHHTGGRHEYLIARSAIECDVIFSLPKLKTHKKAGITVSLKNLVGLNGDKNWLPHHTEGDPSNGGDEHPRPTALHRTERKLVPYVRQLSMHAPHVGPWLHQQARRVGLRVFGANEDVIRSGNWYGNDTIWRMCLDLNKLVLYGNPDGSLRPGLPEYRKRHYVLVDGIIAGEGRGPVDPDPTPAGVVIFGLNPATVDAACAYLMGFDPECIPIVRQAFLCTDLPLADGGWQEIEIVSNRAEWNGPLAAVPDDATFHFAPHFGWNGRIERRINVGSSANSGGR